MSELIDYSSNFRIQSRKDSVTPKEEIPRLKAKRERQTPQIKLQRWNRLIKVPIPLDMSGGNLRSSTSPLCALFEYDVFMAIDLYE